MIDNLTNQNAIVGQGPDGVGHGTGGLMTLGDGRRFSTVKSLFAANVTRAAVDRSIVDGVASFGQSIPVSSQMWTGLPASAAANNDPVTCEAVTGVPEPALLGVVGSMATLSLRRRPPAGSAARQ